MNLTVLNVRLIIGPRHTDTIELTFDAGYPITPAEPVILTLPAPSDCGLEWIRHHLGVEPEIIDLRQRRSMPSFRAGSR